jgi:hypothetical protein
MMRVWLSVHTHTLFFLSWPSHPPILHPTHSTVAPMPSTLPPMVTHPPSFSPCSSRSERKKKDDAALQRQLDEQRWRDEADELTRKQIEMMKAKLEDKRKRVATLKPPSEETKKEIEAKAKRNDDVELLRRQIEDQKAKQVEAREERLRINEARKVAERAQREAHARHKREEEQKKREEAVEATR